MTDDIPRVTPQARAEEARRRSRVEWAMAGGAIAIVLLALVLLTFQPDRAAREGFLSGIAWRYLQGVLMIVLVFALFTLGLNLEFGQTGLVNFGHAAFMAIGAYAAAVITWHTPGIERLDTLPSALYAIGIVLAGAFFAVVFALILGAPTLKLREDYLAIVTIGAAEILRRVFLNEEWLTRGPHGLFVPIPGASGILDVDGTWGSLLAPVEAVVGDLDPYYTFTIVITIALVAGAYLFLERLARAPWGRVVRAIREDEDVARALGKDAFKYKMQALAVGSVVASLSGAMYAWHTRWVTPDSFLPIVTFYAFIMLVMGGVGNNKGAIVGAFLLWGLFEVARNLSQLNRIVGFDIPLVAEFGRPGPQQVVFIGLLLIILMMVRPQGLVGRREEMLFGK